MKAFILAAGYGTRLKPLTDNTPKALVPVAGEPMIVHVIRRVASYGFTEIIVNVHHFHEQMKAFLSGFNENGITIRISDESDQLFDTGGALKKAEELLNDGTPFLVHNTDILSDLDLGDLYRFHSTSGNLVTLAVKDRPTSRSLLISPGGFLTGWRDNRNGETLWVNTSSQSTVSLAFSGIHVVSPAIFPLIIEKGAFPLIPLYLRLAAHYRVGVYRHDADFWLDMGQPANLQQAGQYILSKK